MSKAETTIRSLLFRDERARTVADDDNLLESGLLDSVGVLSLVAGLEKTYKLRIDTKHMTEENFRSIRAIADLVRRLGVDTGRRSEEHMFVR